MKGAKHRETGLDVLEEILDLFFDNGEVDCGA